MTDAPELDDDEIDRIWERAEEDAQHAWGSGFTNRPLCPYAAGTRRRDIYDTALRHFLAKGNW